MTEWSVNQSIILGRIPGCKIDSVPLFAKQPDQSLDTVVAGLNSGILIVRASTDYCLALCDETKTYHLLYKTGMKERALEIIGGNTFSRDVSASSLHQGSSGISFDQDSGDDKYPDYSFKPAMPLFSSEKERVRELEVEVKKLQNQLEVERQKNRFFEESFNSCHKASQVSSFLCCDWDRQLSTATTATWDSLAPVEKESMWCLRRSIALGLLPTDSPLRSHADAIDEDKVDSLREAVSMLNSGELSYTSEFRIVFSRTACGHYLLYAPTCKENAEKLVADERSRLLSCGSAPG